MTRIVSIMLLFSLLGFASSGCAHRGDSAATNPKSFERMQVETKRAFALERQADLVIDYEDPGTIELYAARQGKPIVISEETLEKAIATTTTKRDLAVVIIGKPLRHAVSEPQLSAKVDAIEAILKAQGFTRVAFQLASATGRKIYRE